MPVAVEGVDDPVVGEMVARDSVTAERRRALAEAPRLLRLTEPLQHSAWSLLLGEVERPVRTTELARRLEVSREHLSRQFGAGGAPNLKRVIDLTRIACAAQLLANPGYPIPVVVRLLHFASSSHLSGTARRIANVSTGGLGTWARGVCCWRSCGGTRGAGGRGRRRRRTAVAVRLRRTRRKRVIPSGASPDVTRCTPSRAPPHRRSAVTSHSTILAGRRVLLVSPYCDYFHKLLDNL